MISYFPAFYPDELVYSLLSRYYAASGYMAYIFAAEELFVSKTVRPDMEFINRLTDEAVRVVTKHMPIEAVVEKHTMFPYYGRFLPLNRRKAALSALTGMTGNYRDLMPVPNRKSNKERCMRYCPACAANDREKYGETYWHRVHQMIGLNVCPVHKCRLSDSSLVIGNKTSPAFKTAEELVPKAEPLTMIDNEIELKTAEYMVAVFQADVDMNSDVAAGEYLHYRMENTKYRSVRGQQRNIALLHSDFMVFYKNLPDNWFTELFQIQKVLTGDRLNFYEICLMAFFLGIRTCELTNMALPENSQQELFDEKVYRLHEQGLKYPAIAKRLNASYEIVKSIGERRYGTYHKNVKPPAKSGKVSKNWEQIDLDTLPLVRNAIRDLQGDGSNRPKKVTIFAVEKMLGLPGKAITTHLPKCLYEIQRHTETQEQYWEREVVWAARQILNSGDTLSWRKIRCLTNMRRVDFEQCLPYVREYTGCELAELIEGL